MSDLSLYSSMDVLQGKEEKPMMEIENVSWSAVLCLSMGIVDEGSFSESFTSTEQLSDGHFVNISDSSCSSEGRGLGSSNTSEAENSITDEYFKQQLTFLDELSKSDERMSDMNQAFNETLHDGNSNDLSGRLSTSSGDNSYLSASEASNDSFLNPHEVWNDSHFSAGEVGRGIGVNISDSSCSLKEIDLWNSKTEAAFEAEISIADLDYKQKCRKFLDEFSKSEETMSVMKQAFDETIYDGTNIYFSDSRFSSEVTSLVIFNSENTSEAKSTITEQDYTGKLAFSDDPFIYDERMSDMKQAYDETDYGNTITYLNDRKRKDSDSEDLSDMEPKPRRTAELEETDALEMEKMSLTRHKFRKLENLKNFEGKMYRYVSLRNLLSKDTHRNRDILEKRHYWYPSIVRNY